MLALVRRDPANAAITQPYLGFERPLHRARREHRFLVAQRLDRSVAADRAAFVDAVNPVTFHSMNLHVLKNKIELSMVIGDSGKWERPY